MSAGSAPEGKELLAAAARCQLFVVVFLQRCNLDGADIYGNFFAKST